MSTYFKHGISIPVVVHHVIVVRVLVLTGDLEAPHQLDLYREVNESNYYSLGSQAMSCSIKDFQFKMENTANLLLRHGDMLLEDRPDDGFQQRRSSQRTVIVVESLVLWLVNFDQVG